MPLLTLQGVGQMSPAQQHTLRKALGGTARASGRKRSKGSKKRSTKSTVKRRSRSASSGSRGRGRKVLKKGSAAAKAYMAKIRKMRKRK